MFVDHVARLSGGEIALLRTLPALLPHVDAHVVLGERGPLVERLGALGVRVTVLPLRASVRDTRRDQAVAPAALRQLLGVAGAVADLRRLLRRERPDLVHTNSLKAALYGGLAGRLAGVPVLWHVRDRLTADYLSMPTAVLVRLAAHLLPTQVIANSAATLVTLPARRRGSVLLNPVVPDAVALASALPPDRDSDLVVGMVGRLAPWKGQDLFLRAFAHAFTGLPGKRARIIGSAMFGEDAYADGLRRLADELGVTDQVEFTGFREDVWAELARLDVLVHASLVPEPFGQVVLEGMAAGLPVVASGEGGPAELITHGVDGLLFEPRSSAALAGALLRLAGDRPARTRLGDAARRAAAEYTPEATATSLLSVYEQVLGR